METLGGFGPWTNTRKVACLLLFYLLGLDKGANC